MHAISILFSQAATHCGPNGFDMGNCCSGPPKGAEAAAAPAEPATPHPAKSEPEPERSESAAPLKSGADWQKGELADWLLKPEHADLLSTVDRLFEFCDWDRCGEISMEDFAHLDAKQAIGLRAQMWQTIFDLDGMTVCTIFIGEV